MSSWHSYPKVYNLGHRAITDLFRDPVVVQEKVDGSQFSFGVFDGKIKVKSRGREFDVEAPDGLFQAACETVKRLAPELKEGYTYRGEVLCKPRHNALEYERVPEWYKAQLAEQQFAS